ncbi:ABC transporter ATP-binding protein [Salmonella enterica subsp. enterica serovar Newport]|nr:ABC transporter ATP-binding protein [Salmonella enterica subsp. enterica serovar Newport]
MSADTQCHHLVRLENVTRTYGPGASGQTVLHNVSLSIPAGQSCAIVGASGSGKSTLLNLAGLLDKPTSGKIFLAGSDMTQASPHICARVRNELIGFVFQSFNLLPRLDALDNVALPLLYRGMPRQMARQTAQAQLEHVGLASRQHHRPADLSGGQRQRVAIARALVGKPALLLADEPTGNLDRQTAQEIVTLLLSLNSSTGTTLVMVTHDNDIARQMERCIKVHDGRISGTRHNVF